MLASGGRAWPGLRRLKKDDTGGLEVEPDGLGVVLVLGCLF